MQASGLTECISFKCTSALWGESCFFVHLLSFPHLLRNHLCGEGGGIGSIHWISVLGALIYIWRPKITDGGDISCLLIFINIFFSHAEAEAPVFWLPDANSQLIGRIPHTGKDWGQKEKRVSENEMIAWHHQCNGHEHGQTSGDGEGQGGLEGYRPWGRKESDMTSAEQPHQVRTQSIASNCYYYLKRSTAMRLRNGLFPAVSVEKDVTVIRDYSPPV